MKDAIFDTFTYTVEDNDDEIESNEATVTVKIICNRQGPIAVDDYYETDENTPINTFPKNNDRDQDGTGTSAGLELGVVDEPNIGSIRTRGNTVIYTPDNDYCDKIYTDYYTAEYAYTVTDASDDRLSASATVYILSLIHI